jgi:hypothetical protein
MLGTLGFGGAVCEWVAILRWRRRRGLANSLRVKQAQDKWKPLLIAVVAAVTLSLELWIDHALGAALWNYAVTVFGISTLITLGYAWFRPIELNPMGLILGASQVGWHEVREVSTSDDGQQWTVQLTFRHAHHLYGSQLQLRVPANQVQELLHLVPPGVKRELIG